MRVSNIYSQAKGEIIAGKPNPVDVDELSFDRDKVTSQLYSFKDKLELKDSEPSHSVPQSLNP
jgi:hypothetical protein